MSKADELVIELSKTKITLLIVGSLIFVLLGVWFLSMDVAYIESQKKFNSPVFIYSIGIVTVIFFGACGVYSIKKFFDTKPGIIISERGMCDNSSGLAVGWIPWGEITGISTTEIHKQKLLFLKIKEPSKYANVGNKLKRRISKLNVKMYGTPIIISANSLKVDFETLVSTIEAYLQKHDIREK